MWELVGHGLGNIGLALLTDPQQGAGRLSFLGTFSLSVIWGRVEQRRRSWGLPSRKGQVHSVLLSTLLGMYV